MKFKLILLLLFVGSFSNAQTVTTLNDPHIVAMEDRMVYKSWGNMLPTPRYFLGIQTRLSYSMTWGMLAPNQNKRYREGEDIRPLSANGEQTQREALTLLHSQQTELMEEDAEVIGEDSMDEFYHHTSINYAVDPLFVLYYNKKLKPIREWNPETFIAHMRDKMVNDNMFSSMNLSEAQINKILTEQIENQNMTNYMNEMDVLTEKYDMAISFPMGRGKRLLSYHDMYITYQRMYNSFINNLILTSRIKANIEAYDRTRVTGTPSNTKRLFDNNDPFDDLATFYNVATNFRIDF